HDMNPASNISLISAFISVYQRSSASISGLRLHAKPWPFRFSTLNDQNIRSTSTENRERIP
ncbi:MAG: hypothetical protein ACODAD_01535, partial [Planctomycetota bacterium]